MGVNAARLTGWIMSMLAGLPMAEAQTVRWKNYLHPEGQAAREFYDFYLAGVKDGLISSSVAAHEKLMCLPQTSVLTNEQLDGLMKRWAENQAANPHLDEMPVGLVALAALRKEYPCP